MSIMKRTSDIVKEYSDDDLMQCCKEIVEAHKTGVIPPDTVFRRIEQGVRGVGISDAASLMVTEQLVLFEAASRWVEEHES